MGNVALYIPPATFTPTKTPEATATTVFTATATPTITPTSTPTPWLGSKEVMAYPNPSRGNVNFAYTLAGSGKVKIDIYRLTGERVASITEYKDGGQGQTLSTTWEAMGVAPGIYICRIAVTDSSGREVLKLMKKVALIR